MTIRPMYRFMAACLMLTVLVSLSGCGGDGGGKAAGRKRSSASGKVMFDGKPIPAGTVSFAHSESGTVSVCPITNGSYSSKSGDGPIPGENTVNIAGLEAPDGKSLWSGPYSQKVTVEASGYKGDFTVLPADVKPPVDAVVDEELNSAKGGK
ncbi:MAG: hypothetical protein FJ267_01670 [Planctomycetes bacterium]|nr:hypothetical protein [Planctomycetota bacterium]